jgi:hypothetical protein
MLPLWAYTLSGTFHGGYRTLYEWAAVIVESSGANDNVTGTIVGPSEIDRDLTRVGVKSFFLFATLLQQLEAPLKCNLRYVGLSKRQVQQNLIKIIPAELGNAFTAEHLVAGSDHADDRCVESSPTQVIDQDELSAGNGTGPAGTMRVFNTGSRRFIEEAEHVKASAPEGFQRQKTLVRVGMSRHRDHGLKALPGRDTQVRTCTEVTPELSQKLGQQLKRRH